MKILQLHNQYIFKGGEDRVVEEEKKLLIQKGHTVKQIIRYNKEEIKSLYDKIIVVKNLKNSNKSIKILLQEFKKFKPDLVHIHNIFPLWSSSIIKFLYSKNIPIVMTIHNYRFLCSNGLFYRNGKTCEKCINFGNHQAVRFKCYQNSKIKSYIVANMLDEIKFSKILNKVNYFIVLTEFAKKKFELTNIKKSKIVVKPNFISQNINKKIEIIKKNKFIFASRLSEEKGVFILLKAFKEFKFDLTICGDGPLKDEILRNRSINYLGHLKINELNNLYEKSRVLILPTQCYENFPINILEAFRTKTLVLASKIGSINSIVKNNYNGILFEHNNYKDLIFKIKWVIKNSKRCDEIIDNALDYYQANFNSEINYKTLMNTYNNAINDKKKN